MNYSYTLALGSSFSFALASLVFTHYARKVSVIWMNTFKALTALIAFETAVIFTTHFARLPRLDSVLLFVLSGFVGLNIGDLFLVKAFKAMGAARTLVIFSFQPIFLGVFAFVLFNQSVSLNKCFGIFFMIGCVFVMSYEHFKKNFKWDIAGPAYALAGVVLDSVGIILTRQAFDRDQGVSVLEGNFYRCLGATIGFFVISRFMKINLSRTFSKMKIKARTIVLAGGLLGTFISLWMYLTAISVGHLATISAIIGTGPVFAAIFEAFLLKKWPSRYLYVAFILFGCGFYLVL
ncbi:MAG: putative rane protein [Bacteriovoracaceae bacterium]|nr:putative rane protein [Bacteriovoracaceae bacterium]